MNYSDQNDGHAHDSYQGNMNARRYMYVSFIGVQKFVFDLCGSAAETRAAISRVIVDMRNDPDFNLNDADAAVLWGGASAVLMEMENDERFDAF